MFKDSSPGKVEVILQSYECGNEEFCAVVGICDFTLTLKEYCTEEF